ncbi:MULTISPECIES: type 2 isopentenyl-diphosphate Delta-isomerase [Anaerococcus]|jgi:isopentenyl-diphosphate delta-isomerase, type 2|uniref:Isopentenyl-diphosphate delta-isomerase n=1 Tax=Anaerococcus octavius TaxID=54007 RepID=A0A2I1MB31_9FIRM|nr:MULTISPECIES: type 2 isopentenyl-diphosphate Delta-isomerase [Anaerococcus]MDU3177376.1 type 2 isopentenyl-diphosphate Delta-isomerase [Anaerococcus sp.]MDU5535653.1 type 2 isopentenyl-diphosphate Delta-isomerase [Anaerococcus sp.]MDU7411119.1 type 2 isopentenyl-diphosphate Delta-isomerase [Anaerococcus sp.]PKZ17334.1 type 2 isopentenyl-diphosphate Delta-isomerase [Anaerococcus octavius]
MNSQRRERKDAHIENYLRSKSKESTLLDNVYIEHNAISDVSLDEIDTSIEFMDKKISMPLMIDAMTGGGSVSISINEDLSSICESLNIPMAVGSESIALSEEDSRESFELVKYKENLFRIGNLGFEREYEDFIFARDLIDANAMQVHLNLAQELVMKEGDNSYHSSLELIEKLVNDFDYPIIVKETGSGISKPVAKKLIDVGVKYIDVAGKGGTNFIEIEDLRDFEVDYSDLYNWGIPTAKSIIDIRSISDDTFIIASGGVRTAMDLAKSIIIGADMAAMTGEVLNYLLHGGYDACESFLKEINLKLKIIMALLGVRNIDELKNVDYKLTGELKELIEG